ncbi:hypothetical protein BLOT_011226 [Blomia tropicalis]|nr:hypothetical protein BLOT_011226 [Blomia tropicalis]
MIDGNINKTTNQGKMANQSYGKNATSILEYNGKYGSLISLWLNQLLDKNCLPWNTIFSIRRIYSFGCLELP